MVVISISDFVKFLIIAEAEGFELKRSNTIYCMHLHRYASKECGLQSFDITRLSEIWVILSSITDSCNLVPGHICWRNLKLSEALTDAAQSAEN
jgi:hypothetical protein